ncbi:MAG: hypothetical protein LRZ85_03955 [Alphaproteobacteria bacterium]|nr:hypothetical protein [Alphaproteobacteria bacterium]MCD8571648.1 hypothetical protein [Alphaproteobacteria bacterium]
MRNTIKKTYYSVGGSIMAGIILAANDANAQASGTRFNTIAENITTSINQLPGLVTGLSYLIAIILGVLGIMKIKDHVENPSQTPLKEGAIRLAAGGALFALPIIMEAMLNTISGEEALTSQAGKAKLNKIAFEVN